MWKQFLTFSTFFFLLDFRASTYFMFWSSVDHDHFWLILWHVVSKPWVQESIYFFFYIIRCFTATIIPELLYRFKFFRGFQLIAVSSWCCITVYFFRADPLSHRHQPVEGFIPFSTFFILFLPTASNHRCSLCNILPTSTLSLLSETLLELYVSVTAFVTEPAISTISVSQRYSSNLFFVFFPDHSQFIAVKNHSSQGRI